MSKDKDVARTDSVDVASVLTDESMAVEQVPQTDVVLRNLSSYLGPDVSSYVRIITENAILYHQIGSVLMAKGNQFLCEYGLSIAKLNFLLLLRGAPDSHMSMSELSRAMIVTGANVTQLADALETAGFVQRVRLPGDRRVVLVELTPDGLEVLERVLPLQNRFMQDLWADMSEEEAMLLNRLLTKAKRIVSA